MRKLAIIGGFIVVVLAVTYASTASRRSAVVSWPTKGCSGAKTQ